MRLARQAAQSAPAESPEQATSITAPREAVDGASGCWHTLQLIELLFFAYRDFVSDPDRRLAAFSFGRAHHRVLHFVHRNPGLTIAELLDILKITKQSLNRVLKELVEKGFIEARMGQADRRQRHLFATGTGRALAEELSAIQARRINGALSALPPGQEAVVAGFLAGLIDAPERRAALALIGAAPQP